MICQRGAEHGECEPIMGVCEQSPQHGSGAMGVTESLLSIDHTTEGAKLKDLSDNLPRV